jgi:hypothetical protein
MNVISAVPTIKYVSAAYLLGQAASYGPGPVRLLASRSRGLLAAKPAHRLVPFRFGEMTVVASRLRG